MYFLYFSVGKVTILEASGRVGGRVETYRNEKEGWYVELGAMRIPSSHLWVKLCFNLCLFVTLLFILGQAETSLLGSEHEELAWECIILLAMVKYDKVKYGRYFTSGFSAIITLCLNRIVQWFANKMGVKLGNFIMDDNNTFYLINGLRKKTYAVKANPDILKYKVLKSEMGRSANQLLQQALKKVCNGKKHIEGISTFCSIIKTFFINGWTLLRG